MPYLLGLDLGTMFTAAAVLRLRAGEVAGEPEMVNLADHGAQMPSVVFAADSGELVFGDAAQRRALSEPDRVAREFKRRIGDPTPVSLGERAFTAEELAAQLVRHVVELVARREGEWPERIALTHPAGWGRHKQELLAGALAAHELTVTFLAEPQAAALCFAGADQVPPGSTIAVYDLGGGTFDAAVVRKDATRELGAGFTLLGRPDGVDHLGGVDFDQVVFDRVRAQVPDAFEQLDESDPEVWAAVARVRRDCCAAKEALSSDTEASVEVFSRAGRTSVRMHRSEFEDLIRPWLTESVQALQRSLSSAGLESSGPSTVLLVGGSSRIPLVAQMVSEQLDRPVTVETDPKNAIAKGAVLALAPQSRWSWPGVEVPVLVDDPEAGRADLDRTGPIAVVPPSESSTERLATWMADPPTRRVPPVRPEVGDAYVTRDRAPAGRDPDNRTRVLIGAGGLAAALAIVGAVLFWPTAPVGPEGVGAQSTADPVAAPTTSAPAPPASSVAGGAEQPPSDRESGATSARTPSSSGRAPVGGPAVVPPASAPVVRGPVVPPNQIPAPGPAQAPAPNTGTGPNVPVPNDPSGTDVPPVEDPGGAPTDGAGGTPGTGGATPDGTGSDPGTATGPGTGGPTGSGTVGTAPAPAAAS